MPFKHDFMSTGAVIGNFEGIRQRDADIIGIQHSMAADGVDAFVTMQPNVGISANVHPEIAVKCLQPSDSFGRRDPTIQRLIVLIDSRFDHIDNRAGQEISEFAIDRAGATAGAYTQPFTSPYITSLTQVNATLAVANQSATFLPQC